MMKARYRVIYNRKKSLDQKGRALIQIRISFNRQTQKYISTGIYIPPSEWDDKNQEINSKNLNYIYLNNQIKKTIQEIEEFEMICLVNKIPFNKQFLEDHLNTKKKQDTESFNKFWQHELDIDSSLKPSTKIGHRCGLNKITEFKSNILMRDINFDFIQKYNNHLVNQGLSINSIGKHHRIIKKYLNLAIGKGLYDIKQYPYKSNIGGTYQRFIVRTEPTNRYPLDFEELKRIEDLSYPNHPHLQRALDTFLFSCYTGLRFSDYSHLAPEHLHKSQEGLSIQLDRMIKTRHPIQLELFTLFEGKAQAILLKYFNPDKTHHAGHLIFGKLLEQKQNEYLKIIKRDANIQKKLTTHIGRHTFGTLLSILSKGNRDLIQDLMGHSKAETTQLYINLGERMLNRQLRKINWSDF